MNPLNWLARRVLPDDVIAWHTIQPSWALRGAWRVVANPRTSETEAIVHIGVELGRNRLTRAEARALMDAVPLDGRMARDDTMSKQYNANVDLFNEGYAEGERVWYEDYILSQVDPSRGLLTRAEAESLVPKPVCCDCDCHLCNPNGGKRPDTREGREGRD